MSAPLCAFVHRGIDGPQTDRRSQSDDGRAHAPRRSTQHRLLATAGLALAAALAGCSAGGGGSSGGSVGGGGGGGGGAEPTNMQAYTIRWMQADEESVESYSLLVGDQSGSYDRSLSFAANQSGFLADGTFYFTVQLDRNRNQYLLLRAFGEGSSSPPSNELLIPPLGASGAMAAQSLAATPSAFASTVQGSTASTFASLGFATLASAPGDGGDDANGATDSDSMSGPDAEATSSETAAFGTDPDGERDTDADPATPTDSPLRSLDLDGERDFLASNGADALARSGQFTLSLWARPAASGEGRRSLVRMDCASGACESELAVMILGAPDPMAEPTAQLELWHTSAEGERVRALELPLPGALDAWHHLALVVDAADAALRIFVDGALLVSAPSASLPEALVAGEPMSIAFGRGVASDGELPLETFGADSSAAFAGRLGHVATFDEALDAAAITAIAQGGHALDLRGADSETGDATAVALPMPAHYWRLGAQAEQIGHDFGARSLDLDDAQGGVDASHIVADWPEAQR